MIITEEVEIRGKIKRVLELKPYSHTKVEVACDFCENTFNRKEHLTGHMRRHSGERPYKCTHKGCDCASITKSDLTMLRYLSLIILKRLIFRMACSFSTRSLESSRL